MPGKKMHHTEVIPFPKRRTALDWHISARIENIVAWICVLGCVVLLILLSHRSVPAAELNAVCCSKILFKKLCQTVDKRFML